MARLSTLNKAACVAEYPIVHFADLDWPSGRVRATDWPGSLAWGGNTWLGLGTLGAIGVVQESLDLIANPLQLGFFIGEGVDDALVTAIMSDRYQGKAMSVYAGWFGPNGQLVDTPDTLWSGLISNVELDFVASQATVTGEYRLRKEPPSARMTDEDQRTRTGVGDLFFNLLTKIAGYTARWGEIPVKGGSGGIPNGHGYWPPPAQP